ncbi:DUF4058 family protein [Iningainema tapete]|uniref:DUF4058 family protein n=1 Tax=Iningainema tapete BLCC-T55 TaxID=2748662 RepID=A0A8J7BXU1_9CYAN|nr:DUF4058 family protein [Iningainema tapete]MBD2774347.1 DUF4058 family protein [Iningainema tapete BLCC-T55]
MPSPFPGMNPYLEQSLFWSEFHNRLIVELSNTLVPLLRPKYYIGVETRTYTDEGEELLVGIPDALILSSPENHLTEPSQQSSDVAVQSPIKIRLPMPAEVRERYLEVREVGINTVVTVIEILSPKNKRKGKGRTAYENKRYRVLGSLSHLVEIDLLRGNLPMPMTGEAEKIDYRIVVSRAFSRPVADLYGFSLREAIPDFPLPLKPEDEELVVNLQDAIARVYDFGSYDVRIDYRQPVPPPALSNLNQQWVDELLAPLRRA